MIKQDKILPPTFLFICLLLTFVFHLFLPLMSIGSCYRPLGIVFITFGSVINIWTDNLFKKNKTTVKPNKTPLKLITTGSFSFSRHPMYLGFILILVGTAVVLGSLSSFIAPVIMFITLQKKFIPFEEKNLERIFRKEYVEYKDRVRQWL